MSRRGLPTAARRPAQRLAAWNRLAPRPGLHLAAIALLCLAGFGRALSRFIASAATLLGSGLHPAEDWTASADWAEALLPELFLQWMNQLYGGRAYAWIEARQAGGRLAAVSRLQVIEPAD